MRLNSEFRSWIIADILAQMPGPCSRRCRWRRNGEEAGLQRPFLTAAPRASSSHACAGTEG